MDMQEFKVPLRNRKKEIVGHAIVSKEDYEIVSKFKWNLTPRGYVRGRANGKLMNQHQFILGKAPKKMVIDHINGIKCDNRRENLRFVTKAQNSQNKGKRKGGSSDYIGVAWVPKQKKWIVQSNHDSSQIYLGAFEDEKEAAMVYDRFVLVHYGENAKTNGLVKYDEVQHLTIDDVIKKKIERELPAHISFYGKYNKKNPYRVAIIYNKYKFTECAPSLDDAIEILKDFEGQIEEIKKEELEAHNKREIIRNAHGVPMVEVKNVKGEIVDSFTVSEDRWHEVMLHKWSRSNGYFSARFGKDILKVHQFLMNISVNQSDEIKIDHIDKNPKNNTTENLRRSDDVKNSHNKTKRKGTSSKYYGVCWFPHTSKWLTRIVKDGKFYNVGTFKDEKEAAVAYNKKAIELYGEYANLNIFE